MKRTSTWIIAVTLALLANTVAADAPNLLNYQGRLTDPSGNTKNGTFTMQFAVYDAETGGNQLPAGTPWGETQNVTVTNGVFNVLLGSVTALPTNLFEGGPSDASGPLRFLQVTVSGEVLAPRSRVVSSAYSLSNGTAGGCTIRSVATTGCGVQASCVTGEAVRGGGCNEGGQGARVLGSYPSSPDTWSCRFDFCNGVTTNTAFAVCCR